MTNRKEALATQFLMSPTAAEDSRMFPFLQHGKTKIWVLKSIESLQSLVGVLGLYSCLGAILGENGPCSKVAEVAMWPPHWPHTACRQVGVIYRRQGVIFAHVRP